MRAFPNAPSHQGRHIAGIVRHGFTHFELEIQVWRVEVVKRARGLWLAPDELARAALPTVMRKIIAHAFHDLFPARRFPRGVAEAREEN